MASLDIGDFSRKPLHSTMALIRAIPALLLGETRKAELSCADEVGSWKCSGDWMLMMFIAASIDPGVVLLCVVC
jgi:hypothetical protein